MKIKISNIRLRDDRKLCKTATWKVTARDLPWTVFYTSNRSKYAFVSIPTFFKTRQEARNFIKQLKTIYGDN